MACNKVQGTVPTILPVLIPDITKFETQMQVVYIVYKNVEAK